MAKACDELGITPVLAVSDADADAAYAQGRETVRLGPGRAAKSYLDLAAVVQAARQSGCTALHPGWGFLAENPRFAALCEAHGVTFIGPPAHVDALDGKEDAGQAGDGGGRADADPRQRRDRARRRRGAGGRGSDRVPGC